MRILLPLILLLGIFPAMTPAQEMIVENFEQQPETRWRFFTDGVMGGVSSGQTQFLKENGKTHARMTGDVSTANNGGFIQMRLDLADAVPDDANGVRLIARGNDQRYFVHLRTRGTVLPWQYYQAGFDVTADWTEIRIQFETFDTSGRMLRSVPRTSGLKSIAIVAFGREHAAQIDVREIGFY